ncbi:MAG: WD40 repeat domain-containing protein, partial [Cyanobacteriota bacterium]
MPLAFPTRSDFARQWWLWGQAGEGGRSRQPRAELETRRLGSGGLTRRLGSLPAAVALWLVVGPLPLVVSAARSQTPGEPPLGQAPAEAAADPRPFPAIEAGMHTAPIRSIGVDRAGRWAVTASDDKTARLWNLATGTLERVLRGPVGEGNEGKLYAAALSPDGALVALGSWTDPDGTTMAIDVFDQASGRLLQRLPGLPDVVNHLA